MAKQQGSDDFDGSIMSGLTSLDEDTDEFGRLVLQHARDEQRILQAVQGHGQAFTRARPHPRIALTLDNLERNEDASRRPGKRSDLGYRAPSAGSSTGSEPPLNPPREWGRKARQSNGWLRRMQESQDRETETQELSRPDDGVIYARKTAFTGDESHQIDWAATAYQSQGSVQGGSPRSHLRQRPISSPAKMPSAKASPDRYGDWEDELELTAASLLASTPAMPSRNPILDQIREREIQAIKNRAVASSRLDQIRERVSSADFKSPTREIAKLTTAEESADAQSRRSSGLIEGRHVPRRRHATSDKENQPFSVQGESAAISYSEKRELDTLDFLASNQHTSRARSSQRVEGRQGDPLVLLKKLARVSSPSMGLPIKQTEASGDIQKSPQVYEDEAVSQEPQRLPGVSAEGPSSTIQTPATSRTQTSAKTPVVTGAWVATPGPNAEGQNTVQVDENDRIPSVEEDDLDSQAIDPKTLKGNSGPQDAKEERSSTVSSLPRSALADLVHDARLHPQDMLGDSTINSLEDILDPTIEATPTVELGELQAQLVQLHEAGKPLTQADKDRRQELLAIEGMNKRLRAARTSIKDASRGLRRVEASVDAATDVAATSDVADASHRRVHHASTCNACGRHTSVFRALWSEICDVFYSLDNTKRLGLRLTWPGAICVAFWTWYAIENMLCSIYCQPLYAYTMTDFGVDIDAPRYPFVLPTLIFRPFRRLWSPVLQSLAFAIGGLFSYVSDSWSSDGAKATGNDITRPGFEYYYGGADWNAFDWGSRLHMAGKGGAAQRVKWFSDAQGMARDTLWTKTRLERASVWTDGETELESDMATAAAAAAIVDPGTDRMADDEFL